MKECVNRTKNLTHIRWVLIRADFQLHVFIMFYDNVKVLLDNLLIS